MDYKKARQSMVDSQIHPMGVTSDAILNAFLHVPREEFVPDKLKSICYCDEDIKVAPKRYLMEPSVFARLIEEGNVTKNDAVLTIGSGVGYSAAILSQLCGTVVALEEQEDLLQTAQASWDKLGYSNIAAISGKISDGVSQYAPYDVIIFNGAISKLPETIKDQIKEGGRILTIIRTSTLDLADAVIFNKNKDGSLSSRVLFEAGTPYLNGFSPEKEFVF